MAFARWTNQRLKSLVVLVTAAAIADINADRDLVP
jgi:hypothetical protein